MNGLESSVSFVDKRFDLSILGEVDPLTFATFLLNGNNKGINVVF